MGELFLASPCVNRRQRFERVEVFAHSALHGAFGLSEIFLQSLPRTSEFEIRKWRAIHGCAAHPSVRPIELSVLRNRPVAKPFVAHALLASKKFLEVVAGRRLRGTGHQTNPMSQMSQMNRLMSRMSSAQKVKERPLPVPNRKQKEWCRCRSDSRGWRVEIKSAGGAGRSSGGSTACSTACSTANWIASGVGV